MKGEGEKGEGGQGGQGDDSAQSVPVPLVKLERAKGEGCKVKEQGDDLVRSVPVHSRKHKRQLLRSGSINSSCWVVPTCWSQAKKGEKSESVQQRPVPSGQTAEETRVHLLCS